MTKTQDFTTIGTSDQTIQVRLSYKIVELFSEGLYASPNKAIEELIANSFDAGAQRIHVLLSPNLHDQNATIAVFDDGNGMDSAGLKQHWLIGISNKRSLAVLPQNRQQIGKFGIGKLATYVLASQLTHFSKSGDKYYSASMDYRNIDKRVDRGTEPRTPVKIPLRTLTKSEAQKALGAWTRTEAFKKGGIKLFGVGAPASWTVAILSSLKPKVHEIKPGVLEWVLRTALPLRPDFNIWLDGKKLQPSKQGKGLLEKWILGKDLVQLPRPAPKDITVDEKPAFANDSDLRYGLVIPGLGRITGYVEVYKDLLTGKSDNLGRSYGFFVYVFGRLVNVSDGHFGISPNELRHGTFGRFRLVVNIDGLDEELRSNREAISEGPLLGTAQDVLRAIFNAVRSKIENFDEGEEPGAQLARKLAASPSSLSRRPIIDLARAVLNGQAKSRHLLVPKGLSPIEQDDLISSLEQQSDESAQFVAGLTIDFDGSASAGFAQYDVSTRLLRINAWHPFVAVFYGEFTNKNSRQPLEIIAMAEVLLEAHLFAIGVTTQQIDALLSLRDQLLRNLANEVPQQNAFAIASALKNARNNPDALEEKVCLAFTSLGFEVIPIGGSGEPDGVATALLGAGADGKSRQYSVSLEAKSKREDKGKVAASTVKVSAIGRQRDKYKCQHAVVIGRDFPVSRGEESALAIEISDDLKKASGTNTTRTITLLTIDDLARLVRLRPLRQLGLVKLRELFQTCRLPSESSRWIDAIQKVKVEKPPYAKIVNAIEKMQKKRNQSSVQYSALANELSHLDPPILYETDGQLMETCKGMAQMAGGAMFAGSTSVELDQSAANVLAAIDAALRDDSVDDL